MHYLPFGPICCNLTRSNEHIHKQSLSLSSISSWRFCRALTAAAALTRTGLTCCQQTCQSGGNTNLKSAPPQRTGLQLRVQGANLLVCIKMILLGRKSGKSANREAGQWSPVASKLAYQVRPDRSPVGSVFAIEENAKNLRSNSPLRLSTVSSLNT